VKVATQDIQGDCGWHFRYSLSLYIPHEKVIVCTTGTEAEIVEFDKLGCPVSLLGCGHHFNDAKINRQSPNARTPMDDMITRVKDHSLACPK
jgi:hypothetical protein